MKQCQVEGCDRKLLGKGYCSMHYQRLRKSKTVGGAETRYGHNPVFCAVPDCGKRHEAKGYCNVHYKRMRLYDTLEARNTYGLVGCLVDGCLKDHYSKGYCNIHYRRQLAHGDDGLLWEKPTKKERYKSKLGYVILYDYKEHPNAGLWGQIAEHTLVMSEYLGRPLRKGENVHHINGIRDDNRIENLELWTTSQPPGQRVDDKLAWAREFINTYGDEEIETCVELWASEVYF